MDAVRSAPFRFPFEQVVQDRIFEYSLRFAKLFTPALLITESSQGTLVEYHMVELLAYPSKVDMHFFLVRSSGPFSWRCYAMKRLHVFRRATTVTENRRYVIFNVSICMLAPCSGVMSN